MTNFKRVVFGVERQGIEAKHILMISHSDNSLSSLYINDYGIILRRMQPDPMIPCCLNILKLLFDDDDEYEQDSHNY